MSVLRRRRDEVVGVRVDPVACEGVALCLHLAPDVLTADDWGYPIVGAVDDARTARQARAAAHACPRRALHLTTRARDTPA